MNVQDRLRSRKIRREAEGYLELGLPQHALQTLGRLGRSGPVRRRNALSLGGEGLQELGRFLEALLPLERAVRMAPGDLRINLALGWCYKRTGRLDLAVGAIQRSLKSNPHEAILHYNLACYLSLAGMRRKALFHIEQALTMNHIFQKLIDAEADFDPLRDDPRFRAICADAERQHSA